MAKFRYYNENPQGERINDCVTRAITLTSRDLPYSVVRKKLFHTARLLDCTKLCPTCYSFLINQVLGGIPTNCEGMTVGEFSELHPYGTYLIRIEGHLTAIIDNVIYDTWDCRDRFCTLAWKMK
jgi:hypothetical protein